MNPLFDNGVLGGFPQSSMSLATVPKEPPALDGAEMTTYTRRGVTTVLQVVNKGSFNLFNLVKVNILQSASHFGTT